MNACASVNEVARYGCNSGDKTSLDQKVQQLLGADEKSRAPAARMLRTFLSAPNAVRTRTFGDLAEPLNAAVTAERVSAAIAQRVRMHVAYIAEPDDVGEGVPPAYDPAAIYMLQYAGLCCREESDWDHGTTSDEPYVITSVVEVANGQNSVRTERHR